jgi:hypothetical protein
LIDTQWQPPVSPLRGEVVAYLLVSILLRVVTIHLLQFWVSPSGQTAQRDSTAWTSRLGRSWAAAPARFIYYVGLPYLTLVLGVIPGRYLGLVGLERLPGVAASTPGSNGILSQVRAAASTLLLQWLPDIGQMAGLAALMGVLLGVAWFAYGRLKRQTGDSPAAEPVPGGTRSPTSFVRISYAAIHWSFYRAGMWVLLGDLYLATVCGVLVVAAEWLLTRLWAFPRARAVDVVAIEASLLVTTATIFYFVPNLWLLIPVHWLLAQVSWRAMSSSVRP